MPDYTQDQLWKLYDKLPRELQEAVFSEETANHIADICKRYDIAENKIPDVAKYTGRVLLGVLSPENLQKMLQDEVGLKKDVAQNVTHELDRFVFAPVKYTLAQIYHLNSQPEQKAPVQPSAPAPATEKMPAEKVPAEEMAKSDLYREKIEE